MIKSLYLAVDAIIPTHKGIVLIRRGHDPFKGRLAFPGGLVESLDTVEETLKKEVKEETNGNIQSYELLEQFSAPDRDPRGRTVSIAYIVDVSNEDELKAGDDATELYYLCGKDILYPDGKILVPYWLPRDLAFDHAEILYTALNHLKNTRCM